MQIYVTTQDAMANKPCWKQQMPRSGRRNRKASPAKSGKRGLAAPQFGEEKRWAFPSQWIHVHNGDIDGKSI